MGWFKRDNIHFADIPEDKNNPNNLQGFHPVIIDEVKGDKVNVIGCTSNSNSQKYGAVKVETHHNNMSKATYARCDQGLREIDSKHIKDKCVDAVKNGSEIRRGLR